MSLLLGFGLKMGGKGLWMGISSGSLVQFILLATIVFFSNWQKMSDKAREGVFSGTQAKERLMSDGTIAV